MLFLREGKQAMTTMFHEGQCEGCGKQELVLGSRGLCDRCMVQRYEGEVGADTIAAMLGLYARARDGETAIYLDAFDDGAVS